MSRRQGVLFDIAPGISQRTDFALQHSVTALLVIDVQSYLSPHAAEGNDNNYFTQESFPRAIGNIDQLVRQFRVVRDEAINQHPHNGGGCEVIFTFLQSMTNDRRDISLDYKLSGPLLANIPTPVQKFNEIFCNECLPDPTTGKGDIILPKTSCSVFQSTNLHYLLTNLGVQQLVVTGQLTDQCVQSAVRDAADLGYLVTVVEDACAAHSRKSHEHALRSLQGFCRILCTQDVMQEIQNGLAAMSTTPSPLLVDENELSLADVSKFLKDNGYTEAAMAVVNRFSDSNDQCDRIHETESDNTTKQPTTHLKIAGTTPPVPGKAAMVNDDDIVTVFTDSTPPIQSNVAPAVNGHKSDADINKNVAQRALPAHRVSRDPSTAVYIPTSLSSKRFESNSLQSNNTLLTAKSTPIDVDTLIPLHSSFNADEKNTLLDIERAEVVTEPRNQSQKTPATTNSTAPTLPRYKVSRDPSVWFDSGADDTSFAATIDSTASPRGNGSSLSKAQYQNMRHSTEELESSRLGSSPPGSANELYGLNSNAQMTPDAPVHENTSHTSNRRSNDPPAMKVESTYNLTEL